MYIQKQFFMQQPILVIHSYYGLLSPFNHSVTEKKKQFETLVHVKVIVGMCVYTNKKIKTTKLTKNV